MGLTDNPFYKNMVEGYDSKIIVGTMRVSGSGHPETFPLFLIDYHGTPKDMEKHVAWSLDDQKRLNLVEKDGTYTLSVDEAGTVLIFAEGETAAHTAPTFWAQYTPGQEEHQAFQKEFSRLGVWMFLLVTKNTLREFMVADNGTILFKRKTPLTPELRKMLGLDT